MLFYFFFVAALIITQNCELLKYLARPSLHCNKIKRSFVFLLKTLRPMRRRFSASGNAKSRPTP